MKSRALVAMSGGVDSAAAAALMLDAGWDCLGATMKLLASGGSKCCSLEDINDARAAAHRLGIPHYVFNYTDDFARAVIKPFVSSYERGKTPNPCIECNRVLKFSLLLRRAFEIEAEVLVTGHYARIENGARRLLKKGIDPKKDQSYVLYMLTQEQLASIQFPLGELTKVEARKIAEARGLANAQKRESQDICFVEGGDYGAFLEAYSGKEYPAGDILDEAGKVVGRHKGLPRYTLGQRRGVGVALNGPAYIAAKNHEANTITLAPESYLYSKKLDADNINLISCDGIKAPLRLKVKTRYLQTEQRATVEQTADDSVHVEFDEPQRAITPGQAAVFYDGDIVVGGGTIR
jgi:tRNA-specific 2-thiouridylase